MYRTVRPFMPLSASGPRAGLIAVTTAGVLWGTSGVVVQLVRGRTGLDPVSIGFYRLAIAAITLLPFTGVRPLLRAVRAAPLGLVLAGAGLAGYQALYFIAVVDVGVSIATVVSLGLAPVAIAVWEAARTRRRPDPVTLGTVAAGVTGLVLITASSTGPGHARPVLGLVAAIGCGLGYAASTVLSRHLAQRVAPMAMTTVSTTVGALVLIPFAFRSGLPVEPSAAGLLVYLGVVATALAYALFYSGLRSTAGSSAVVLTLLEPLTAALLAVLVLGEPLSAAVVAGGALLLGAVAMLYLDPYRQVR